MCICIQDVIFFIYTYIIERHNPAISHTYHHLTNLSFLCSENIKNLFEQFWNMQ